MYVFKYVKSKEQPQGEQLWRQRRLMKEGAKKLPLVLKQAKEKTKSKHFCLCFRRNGDGDAVTDTLQPVGEDSSLSPLWNHSVPNSATQG